MFLRGRGLTFWALLLVFLFLLATRPVDTADAVTDSLAAIVRFLHAVGRFFDSLRA